jgi:hypothetical protein
VIGVEDLQRRIYSHFKVAKEFIGNTNENKSWALINQGKFHSKDLSHSFEHVLKSLFKNMKSATVITLVIWCKGLCTKRLRRRVY